MSHSLLQHQAQLPLLPHPLQPQRPQQQLLSDPECVKKSLIELKNITHLSLRLCSIVEDAREQGRDSVSLDCSSSDGTSAKALAYVLEELPKATADPLGGACDVSTLFRICNALFKYECLPTAFEGLWASLARRSSARVTVVGCGASSTTGEMRCWKMKQPHEDTTALSGKLLTIALVLGEESIPIEEREEKSALESELVTVIWRSEVRRLGTSVSKLVDLEG